MEQEKDSYRSKVSKVFNSFRRSSKMNVKNLWLLGILIFALVFGGVVVPANATMRPLSGTDVTGRDTGREYSIRGIKVWVEGSISGVNTPTDLGQLTVNTGVINVPVKQGSLTTGGHELVGREGTTIRKVGGTDHVFTDSDGRYNLTFLLPFETIPNATTLLPGTEVPVTVGFTLYPGESATYNIQIPNFKRVDPRHRSDDIFKNGDTLELDFRLEPPANTHEIECVTLLPDLSDLDSAFNYTGGKPDNVTELEALVLEVRKAIKENRLSITDDRAGRYNIKYKISDTNLRSPGWKVVKVYAIDYPSVLDPTKIIDIDNLKNILLSTGLTYNTLGIVEWSTQPFQDPPPVGDDTYVAHINLDNRAPNFDFAILNPFVNTPKAIWRDRNHNGIIDGDEWGIEDNRLAVNKGDAGETVNYVFKPGDTVSVMVQINAWDLSLEEFRSVSAADAPTGRRVIIDDVNVIGDISALLDPKKVDLVTDANNNGIPDAAEAMVTTVYSGRGGGDDDYDRHDARGGDDDEDFVENGINERFLFVLTFTINENFKGASGNGPATVAGLPIRFAIKDRAGNISRYSTWKEVYNTATKKWDRANVIYNEATGQWLRYNYVTETWSVIAAPGVGDVVWNRNAGGPGMAFAGAPGKYFPVRIDDTTNGYPDGIYPTSAADVGITTPAYAPDPSQVPVWAPGFSILRNWDKPWAIAIDASAPSVSRISAVNIGATVADGEEKEKVVNGSAVVPSAPFAAGGALPGDYTATPLATQGTNVLLLNNNTSHTGNFIYEISGNEEKLVTLQATFPSDMDVDHVRFMISDTDAPGSYRPMKGQIGGDREVPGIFDIAGNVTDEDRPGAGQNSNYNDLVNGDDDNDRDADLADREVTNARTRPQNDSVDNDADGLLDANDVDVNGILTELYEFTRDEDEDGIMDEDEYVVKVNRSSNSALNLLTATWTFDPVRLARVLKLTPGKAYAIKAIPYDKAGNSKEESAAPVYLVFNVVGPGVSEVAGTAKAILKDSNNNVITSPTIPENNLYILEAETTGNVTTVTFEYSVDKTNWIPVPSEQLVGGTDNIPPFRATWLLKLGNGYLDANGNGVKDATEPNYVAGDPLYIRAVPGKFGNLGKYTVTSGLTIDPQTFIPYDPPIPASVTAQKKDPDITVALTDTVAPIMRITQAGSDTDLTDGALLPVSKDVLLRAVSTDTDIKKAEFQYAVVHPDGTTAEWVTIPSTVDLTILPGSVVAVSKWDTTVLAPANIGKRYNLRCIAEDISGLKDPQKAPIVHVVVGAGKYAAFITDPVRGAEISGTTKQITAVIYNKDTDIGSIRRVIFQYQQPGSAWALIKSVTTPFNVTANYSTWVADWTLYDLAGAYNLRALVEDDQGYVNEGIEINVTVKGTSALRAKVSNFESDSTKNPRVSMKIARDGTNPNIAIAARNDLTAETLRVVLKASTISGSPSKVTFQYKINDPDNPGNDDPKSEADWKDIATDTEAPWEINWDIDQNHELHKLTVSKLIYIRAVAKTDASADQYKDESNYVPYVALVFEETSEPTANIERIERDGISLGDLSTEKRVTGGVLTIYPSIVDQGISDHRASGVTKVELYYKHTRKASRDGDTTLWVKAAEDVTPPFVIEWNVNNIATGKYDLLLVATDQAGNKSANIWNNNISRNLIKVLTIDRTGPVAYIENPDLCTSSMLGADGVVRVSLSSYEGAIRTVGLYYSVTPAIPAEVRTGEGTYTFQYLDTNNNGVFDPGEPFWVINPPGQGTGIPSDGTTTGPTWVKIDEVSYSLPDAVLNGTAAVSSVFRAPDGQGYYYYDINGNGRFDAGETVWKDLAGGNTQRYNKNSHLLGGAVEPIIIGCLSPDDEFTGKKFEDIATTDAIKDITGVQGVTKWADLNANGALDERDFIWIDLNANNRYDIDVVSVDGNNHYAEPIVYTYRDITWGNILDLPPTNSSQFDVLVKASDRKDSAGKDGNWGPEYIGKLKVSNIQIKVQAINNRNIDGAWDETGGGGDYYGKYMRTTGNTVTVKVRVKPRPIAGSKVQLWFRYDDRLYPGGGDANFDGRPDNDGVFNSRWDGIDNDWDGAVDEAQDGDPDGTQEWAEVNTWQLASTTGGSIVTAENADEKWYEVTLVWDVSMLKGEFTYEVIPVVVDGQNYGVNFNYPNLASVAGWAKSDVAFPQMWWGGASHSGYRVVVDHQGPYTYTQATKDTDDYGDTKYAINSYQPLTDGAPDTMIIRINNSSQGDPNSKRNPTGDYTDEPGEDNYRTYDIQAKTVSIVGGLDYTKPFDNIKGVEFQYRLAGGEWKTLGYDYDPDYLSTFDNPNAPIKYNDVVAVERGRASIDPNPGDDNYIGQMLSYDGVIVNSAAAVVAERYAYAPRIIVATWSLDNVDIMDPAKFPWANGADYEFRIIAADQPDVYGNPGNKTAIDPAGTTPYDELAVENRVGDDQAYKERNFLRDINWKLGVPFNVGPAVTTNIFNIPHADIANLEAVGGPRHDGKVLKYRVDNIVPKAEIVRVDETAFAFSPQTGIDPAALANAVDATVQEGDDVLLQAIVNSDPENKTGAGVWDYDASDVVEVRFYARPVGSHTGKPGNPANRKVEAANGWRQVGMSQRSQSDFGNKYTARIDTEKIVEQMGRDIEMMAVAVDARGNEEPLLGSAGEITVRITDMLGPKIKLGGLALNPTHYQELIYRQIPGISRAIIQQYFNEAGDFFSDTEGLDLHNMGNGVFPADPTSLTTGQQAGWKRPVVKVSGEAMHLYVNGVGDSAVVGDIPEKNVVISVIKPNGDAIKPNVIYSKDTTASDGSLVRGKVKHTFTLSEQSALIYLPTWVESGQNVSRFEGVTLRYAIVANGADKTGAATAPPQTFGSFGNAVAMTRTVNSKGEPIWKVDVDIEIGMTCFYFFEVDTVGDNWIIPDPKNLMVDEFDETMRKWVEDPDYAKYIVKKNFMLNVPVISKLWIPGTSGGPDDQIWYSIVNLDELPDGVYEIRAEATDRAGFKDIVSKTVVLDRTPPAVDANTDIKVVGRVKANTTTPITAIIKDDLGVNAIETMAVLFEISRRGNTQEATSTWRYAISGGQANTELDEWLKQVIEKNFPGTPISLDPFNWLYDIALDPNPENGWSMPWLTPNTDQNVKYFVRAIPIDDALNVQVGQAVQVPVWVDGSVPKAKIITASVNREGTVISAPANGFELRPTDKDVLLVAQMTANLDGDLNGDGIIDPASGEGVNLGIKSVTFQYSVNEKTATTGSRPDDIKWYTIPATQYSEPVVTPNADGTWQVTWQVDFSRLYDETKDQYIQVRAVAEDEVGNRDDVDPILSIMILNNVKGPQARIVTVNGENILAPRLAVTKGPDATPSTADVVVEAHNIATATLEYRAPGSTTWTEIKTVTKGTTTQIHIPWEVTKLPEGRYELRAIGYDADGNATTEPHVVTVIVDHTEPIVSSVKMMVNADPSDANFEVTIYPGTALYRYKNGTRYYNARFEAKVDSTDPVDKVEAKRVVLQYFDRTSLQWVTVKVDSNNDGKITEADEDALFSYSKVTDIWSRNFDVATLVSGTFVPKDGLGDLMIRNGDGKIWLRILATDYAGNKNSLDKGFELLADANAPQVIAVYSGGREYEGGDEPTIVAYGGDKVDLWAKLADNPSGVNNVDFYIPASPATATAPTALPVPATTWDKIGSGTLVSTNGYEELWHLEWTTPLNMASSPYTYTIAIKATDKAGNTHGAPLTDKTAQVKVEKDVTPPAPPEVLFVVTHAAQATNNNSLPQILDEYNAPVYSIRKMLPIGADTDRDNYRADKYEVFDLYNDWAKGSQVYIDPDQYDTSIEIWIKTSELEFGVQPAPATWLQYENYISNNSAAPGGLGDSDGPSYIKVPYGNLGRDPGISRVYAEIAYDPNQDGDPSDITGWIPMDNNQTVAGRGGSAAEGYRMDPRNIVNNDWADGYLQKQEPLTISDVVRVPLYAGAGTDQLKGYAYYWVFGDELNPGTNGYETVWNTEASVDDNNETLDPSIGKDGIYFIRTWAEDTSGNGSPRYDAARRRFGYAMIRVHNQDTIPPANTYISHLNGDDDKSKWVPLEWKWHKVNVRTRRNQVGPWFFGAADDTLNATTNNKFFGDIDYVVVEALDNESGTWVNVTKDSKSRTRTGKANYYEGDRMSFYTDWQVLIDSTLVGDGNTKMRAYAVDNGGRFVSGTGEVHNQHVDPDRRNLENKDAVPTVDIKVDNPRAQVVIPATGAKVERGKDTLTIQAVPVELAGWDTAKNGHDVGRMLFMVRRKAAPNGGVNGPWILVDAKDNDLDGKFGEDPVAGVDYDKDGLFGEDPIDPVDTNEPYMVHWTVPNWLVIDDPNTEKVIEETAQYWVVAVAGDSNTGPLDASMVPATTNELLSAIHWDNPYHIISRTQRASLITVVDEHPPRTRVLQVGKYAVPSETKIVVGKTVTIFAGDTEVDWIAPGVFITPTFGAYDVAQEVANPSWPADGAAWAQGLLYPPMYDPDVVWDNQLYYPAWAAGNPAEWRPNDRVVLRYAGPYTADASAPALPTSGQTWDDTAWKVAEANAIDMDDQGDPGKPDWQVTNWVTGGSVLPDGKYFIAITATDDVGHTTGIPVGTADTVMPDIVEIYIKNTVKPVTVSAYELAIDGTLKAVTNGEMERGQPLVLTVDPTMDVEDLDAVEFQYKAKHDYDWKTIKNGVVKTQPYSVTLSPVGDWDATNTAGSTNIALGNYYQFRAVAVDSIGNKTPSSNIIELKVVDNVAMASIAGIVRMDGANTDEKVLPANVISKPRLTGKVMLQGYTDADVVRVTFLYRTVGVQTWTEIEAEVNAIGPGNDGVDNNNNGLIDESGEEWDVITSGPYKYVGKNTWNAVWDTTTLQEGEYELAVLANRDTEDKNYNVSDILVVVVDHNAYDIVDSMKLGDKSPGDGSWVGGWTRRPVKSENPILDPDQKEPLDARGEVDIYVTLPLGLMDLDMGIPTSQTSAGSALRPSVSFQYKESALPNVGDETRDDSTYWKPIVGTDVVYDAASKRFSAVWRTAAQPILNGYYDLRVRIADEAGNVAYWVFAKNVVVDNTAPDSIISSVNGDTTLTYVGGATMATDTELPQNGSVVLRATAVDALTSVAYVQFQVRAENIQAGPSVAGDDADEIRVALLGLSEWTDIGLATKDADPKDSYSLLWDTTGLFEGDYKLRVKVTDKVGNKAYSSEVLVTVVDTVAPVATIVGYYPKQLQFMNWPKKYWFDTIYAATICQADVQEVQFQYRGANDQKWITIGVPAAVPYAKLDDIATKLAEIDDIMGISGILRPALFPPAVALNEAIVEAFNWTGLWGTTWDPKLADGTYQMRAVAKDWSGNVDPDSAPIYTFSVVNGVVVPETPASGISIEFTADLGGTGVGDRSGQWYTGNSSTSNYTDRPSVVITVEAPEKPTVLVLAEVNAPDGLSFGGGQVIAEPGGLVFGGEIVDMKAEEGVTGRYSAALKGDELPLIVGNQIVRLPYLEYLRLGGKITAFASTTNGIVGTSLTMDDLRVYPVTPQLGTNGTVYSKDKVVSVNIPRAALVEPQPLPGSTSTTYLERAGLMITPAITPNTPKDQRLILEPVGQAYSIEFFNNWSDVGPAYFTFRPGFEPMITIDYSSFGLPADAEALGFISVRYWDPQPYGDSTAFGGRWLNDDIINLSVDTKAKKISFNLKAFGSMNDDGNIVPHTIFSIVLEKALGRIDDVTFYDANQNAAFQYPADPGLSYLRSLAGGRVAFRIVDPSGIDENSIRVYIDGGLFSVGLEGVNPSGRVRRITTVPAEDNDRSYVFMVPNGLSLTEGLHTLKIEAWDKSDAVNEANWMMLETTVRFYIDTTPPMVVTHAAQRDGVRFFKSPEGAVASITIVDEGVGLNAAMLQNNIFVDVFKHLVSMDSPVGTANTPLRTIDQGNIINYQRKVLQVTSRPIIEFADDYTPDGIDNETWIGIKDGASAERHKAWRVSYTIQTGQIADGDTYEVVFYASKPNPTVSDYHNENAVYLYEDLTYVYLMKWNGTTDGFVSVNADGDIIRVRVQDYYEKDIQNITASDSFTGYYAGTFLVDNLGNGSPRVVDGLSTKNSYSSVDQFFTRQLVADTRGPVVSMNVPQGVRADDEAATVSATVTDDSSGIANVKLVINGKVVAEKQGPISNTTLEYTFAKGEAARSNEIKVVSVDYAGNETVTRASFGVQEVDGPAISDMSPVGDGVKDATPTISAAYSDPSGIDLSSVTLTLNGAVLTNATVSASSVSYTPTSPLKAGVTYTVKVSVKDTAGSASEQVWTFSLETEAPSITDTTPTGVDQTGTPAITAKFADAGTGIDKSSVKLVVDKKAVEAQVTANSVSYKPADVMAKGKHLAELTVADVAGNIANHSWEFSIEEVAPTITDVAPSGTINNDMPIISAKYSDTGTGIDVNSVVVTINGEVVNATVTGSGVSYAVKEPLKPNVNYTAAIKVADKAGNEASTSTTFSLEGTRPTISGMSPTGTVQTVNVALSANYSDAGSGIDQSTALMKLDGTVVAATPSASGISYQATGLKRGEHTVYVEVADKFGNVASQSWTFTVETTPPTIVSVEPKDEVNTATPVLKATYNDGNGSGIDVRSVVLSLNGQVLPASAAANQVSYAILTPLEKGITYKVSVQVADMAGNIATGDSTFSLETTAPKITGTAPTGTVSEADAAKGVQISAKLSDDGSGVNPDSVKMWLDGAIVPVNATDSAASYTAKSLGYGEHTVRLVVADMLGNTADATWKFSVADSTPPTVTVISPKQDSVVGVRPVIKISYADEGSGVDLTSISVKVDDKPIVATAMAPAKAGETKVVSAGEASYEVKLGYGSHTLKVTLKDVAGNEATAEVKFMVEGDVLEVVKAHNYPNPFAGDSTTITFGLSKRSKVTINIYDFTATLVATIAEDEIREAGEAVEFKWDGTTDAGSGRPLANGVYFCHIVVKTDSETKSEIVKIALVR